MFYNPTNMDVDIKGRIWVTEAVNYRNFNNDSTKFLHHPKGDRVMILEDSNGDGKADISKVFVQDEALVSPLGIAVIGNKVIVSCSPNLIVYTDENG
jgi:glucose/arabinose dehydrogenase